MFPTVAGKVEQVCMCWRRVIWRWLVSKFNNVSSLINIKTFTGLFDHPSYTTKVYVHCRDKTAGVRHTGELQITHSKQIEKAFNPTISARTNFYLRIGEIWNNQKTRQVYAHHHTDIMYTFDSQKNDRYTQVRIPVWYAYLYGTHTYKSKTAKSRSIQKLLNQIN